ncbi:MAG: alpha-L-arabinofuranosidase [Clostridia bacterium]|nr:alpha-L-arabinofuranosidase [Clostridia bacterium]
MKKLYAMLPEELGTINPDIYGHFSEHIGGVFYDGLWVGEDSDVPNIKGFRKDAIEKLRAIKIPVLRWPGGCFAEVYNWRDGIGPRDQRPVRTSWWDYEDGRLERNQVGTHEFIDLCRLIGAEPYFAANITSMTPMDIRDWMDYCNSPRGTTTLALEREKNGSPEPFNVKYWGVGNETWGGGGEMTPEVYAHEYRKYAAVLYNLTRHMGGELFFSGPNGTDSIDWTRRALGEMKNVHYSKMAGYTLHYYCGGMECRGFNRDEWYEQFRRADKMQQVIDKAWGFIVGYGMQEQAKLVIDEWGAWHRRGTPKTGGSGPSNGYNLFEQQCTMRDAIVVGLNLNMFNNNCDKIRMTNVAQLMNNIQSLFLAGGEHCIVTPAYHVFDMFKGHMGATAIRTAIENPSISYKSPKDGKEQSVKQFTTSASVKDGIMTVTLTNADLKKDETISLEIVGGKAAGNAKVTVLHTDDPDTVNTFEEPENVKPAEAVEMPLRYIKVPRASVVTIEVPLA